MNEAPDDAWQPAGRLERGNAAEQILSEVREQILGGRLTRGTKLPTEKQLADRYGVSGATVREAIRGLASMRLVEVRHGSGAYVTAEADQLVALSLQSLIQLERLDSAQVLGVLGALSGYAAELAVTHASEYHLRRLSQALDAADHGGSIEDIAGGLTLFIGTLAEASGNPLLAALCRFLGGIQISLARELAAGQLEVWRNIAGRLTKERRDLLAAIEARDRQSARAAALTYHARASELITALPKPPEVNVPRQAAPTFLTALLQHSAD